MTSGFLNIAKKILRKAVGIGIEEAGVRVCGKTGWDAISTIVSPVIEELERRYPGFMLVPEKIEEAEKDLNTDASLEAIVQEHLATIETGQKEILTVLFRNEETLSSYRTLFFNAFEEADKRAENRHKFLVSEIRHVKTDIEADIHKFAQKPTVLIEPHPTLSGLYEQANGYQYDAMTWLTSRRPSAAAERLSIARSLATNGMSKMGQTAELLATMGYIEKSQAQVCFAENNIDDATHYLADATRYFNEALKLKPNDMSALNGIANIYFFGEDYDAAIELGRTIIRTDSSYGAAISDLGLALEKKLKTIETNDSIALELLKEAIEVDELLLNIMPQQPSTFRSSDFSYVQSRLQRYKEQYNTTYLANRRIDDISLQEAHQLVFQQQQEFFALYNTDNFGGALELTRKSLEFIEQAISKFSDDIYLTVVQGCCYKNEAMTLNNLDHHDQAEKSIDNADQIFQKVLAIQPDNAMALHGRGNVEMQRKNWQEALQFIDRALELQPNYPSAKHDREIISKKLDSI